MYNIIMLIPSKNNGLILVSHPTKNTQNEYFKRSVVLIFEQRFSGTAGFIINKTSHASKTRDFLPPFTNQTVLRGGPLVQDKIFIIYKNNHQWLKVSSDQGACDFLQSPDYPYFVAKGLCFWTKKLLENELKQNLWLPFNYTDELFKIPAPLLYEKMIREMGYYEGLLSNAMGHA